MRHVRDDYTKANLTDRERAMCDYAKKLSLTPGAMREQDLEPLRAVGLSDPEIHDAVQVIAYFNYINRIADGLGTDLEPEMPPQPEGWRRSARTAGQPR